jgi:hypothetical protein
MRKWLLRLLLLLATFGLSLQMSVAQFREGRGPRFGWEDSGPMVSTEGGELVNEDTVQTARETAQHSVGFPTWTNSPGFEHDVFTFTRLVYRTPPGRPSFLGWINDYPDGDLNLSYRLQQLTSIRANPDGRVLKLTNSVLADYPFVFVAQAGGMELREPEALALRNYLRNGGALMADDFWGERDWSHFEGQMKLILPERTWTELPMSHKLFHCVFELPSPMSKLQVPTIHIWRRNHDPNNPGAMPGFGRRGSQDMHVRAWLDDKERIMVIALHNTDTGDGWEREGEDEVYFREFSEARAYPLAINSIFYLLTH